MKIGNASFSAVIIRYYAMMFMVVMPFLIGVPLLAIFAVPIFLSALLGIDFKSEKRSYSPTSKAIDVEEIAFTKQAA